MNLVHRKMWTRYDAQNLWEDPLCGLRLGQIGRGLGLRCEDQGGRS